MISHRPFRSSLSEILHVTVSVLFSAMSFLPIQQPGESSRTYDSGRCNRTGKSAVKSSSLEFDTDCPGHRRARSYSGLCPKLGKGHTTGHKLRALQVSDLQANVHAVKLNITNHGDGESGAKAIWHAVKLLEGNPALAQSIASHSQQFVENILSTDNVQRQGSLCLPIYKLILFGYLFGLMSKPSLISYFSFVRPGLQRLANQLSSSQGTSSRLPVLHAQERMP